MRSKVGGSNSDECGRGIGSSKMAHGYRATVPASVRDTTAPKHKPAGVELSAY